MLPFLVYLVTRWGGNGFVYGLVGATYSVFQLVGAPILGRWSDRWGRRKILLLSQLGTLVSWAIFVVAFCLPERPLFVVDSSLVGRFSLTLPIVVMFVARACDGLTGGNVSVANAYLAPGNGLMWPSVVSLLSLAAGRRYQGAVQGLAGSAGAIASIVGLIAGGVVYTRLESRAFGLSSLAIFAVFLLALRLRDVKRGPDRTLSRA